MNQQFLTVTAKIILTVQDGIKDLKDNTAIILLPKVIGVSLRVVRSQEDQITAQDEGKKIFAILKPVPAL